MNSKTLPVDAFTRNSRYSLHTDLRNMSDISHSLYKRVGDVMVLVDTFNSYKKANKEARNIIREYESLNFLMK